MDLEKNDVSAVIQESRNVDGDYRGCQSPLKQSRLNQEKRQMIPAIKKINE